MNILFLSIGRLEDLEFRGIYTDLLRKFRDEGHKVFVVSSREKRLNKPTEYTKENGVQFLRVKTGNITKTNIVEKGISTILLESLFLKAIKKYMKNVKFDLVIYSTPPITLGKVISYVKKRNNAKSYLLLKDIFPQNAVDLNILNKKNLLYKYFRLKEKKLYAQSDFIGCMSQANVDFILANNSEIPSDTVEVCPNSITPITIEKNPKKIQDIKRKYNIPSNKTIFVYGGNIGKPQGIDFLKKCLKANKDNNQVYFVIAGTGTEYIKLKTFIESENLKNTLLIAQLPKDDYELLANSCDVGLIFLDHRFTIPNFPSRILSYMQSSMPVFAVTDKYTDIGKIVENGNFGYWCESNDIEGFNEKLKLFYDYKNRENMGRNAREYLEEKYTSQHSYEIIMSHFPSIEKR